MNDDDAEQHWRPAHMQSHAFYSAACKYTNTHTCVLARVFCARVRARHAGEINTLRVRHARQASQPAGTL